MNSLGLTDLSTLIQLVEGEILKTKSDIEEIEKYNTDHAYQQNLKFWRQWLEINESLLMRLEAIQRTAIRKE
ncbi:hypothetical protein [Paenibacillus zanthoxyli]|uniref:hypothetical protein n=1 Tax=Paenibacillus zanthoxyli TaxID=369399 RepID=UPI00046FA1EF|nr:hypothetical protein [Paenibacillus zanthoxyli]